MKPKEWEKIVKLAKKIEPLCYRSDFKMYHGEDEIFLIDITHTITITSAGGPKATIINLEDSYERAKIIFNGITVKFTQDVTKKYIKELK